jgi:nucleoside-diphosphate-sugar epimerase
MATVSGSAVTHPPVQANDISKAAPGDSRSGLDNEDLSRLVRQEEALFGELKGASILITGATGWFGVWMLDALCAADDMLGLDIKLSAVSRDPRRFLQRFPRFISDPRLKWIKSDVRQLGTNYGPFSHVIHAAADSAAPSGPEASRQLFDSIVEGTRRAVALAGPSCRSFLLLSSGAVYGPGHLGRTRVNESDLSGPDPCSAQSAYAEGKRAAETIAAMGVGSGMPIRIARCFAFVGPHMPFDRHFAIGNFIADAVHGRIIRVKSDGRAERSYLYMADLLRALFRILCHGSIGRPYNVGSDVAVTIAQLANCVDRVAGGCGVAIEGAAYAGNESYVPDITRLKEELSFVPDVPLEMAIARTAAWYRARAGISMPI